MSGWIGVDLDGTLARYDGWKGPEHIGEPVQPMLDRVKEWIGEGKEVRIFTARAWAPTLFDDPERNVEAQIAVQAIKKWLRKHGLPDLKVTCVKDYGMIELYDDRAVQVRMNTGELVGEGA